jgi:four helix bundle protein
MVGDMKGIRKFEDFDAWKLSTELRDLVYRLTSEGRVTEDEKFCNQIRDSTAGPPRNISEGFGRFYPKDFSNFTRYAKASLEETRNHLLHAKQERYFSETDLATAMRLCKRALGATKGLHRYLLSCKGRLPWDPRPDTKDPTPNQNQEPEPEPQEPQEPQEPPEPRP